ncbi:MAG: pyridoxal phosphate-dependent aminotransferase [Desulfobacteraceae bacterium]|nr:pyridoxal phosphate-dependent aminotransferase [Desulfobacteraceae bacterium]
MLTTRFQNDFADRITRIGESKTTGVLALAQTLRQKGRDIINLAPGEPDFETPEPVIAATAKALEEQKTRYGPVAGIPALRDRIAKDFAGYTQDNIIVTNGAKQALYALFQVICQTGDEVILPLPCWVSFPEQIKLTGARPVWAKTTKLHQLDPQSIADAVTPRTKAVVINTPNNPTGAVYFPEALKAVENLARQHGFYLVADEAYHGFAFDGVEHRGLFELMNQSPYIITVRSFSKQYSMTGFRLGYVAAQPPIVQTLTRLQSHLCGNVCTFAQYGALAAMNMDKSVVEKRRLLLQKRRDIAYTLARKHFECSKPQGAFYLFANAARVLKKGESDESLAMDLLEKAGVAVVPGKAFGAPDYLRLCFGVKEDVLHEAFDRIEFFLEKR